MLVLNGDIYIINKYILYNGTEHNTLYILVNCTQYKLQSFYFAGYTYTQTVNSVSVVKQ